MSRSRAIGSGLTPYPRRDRGGAWSDPDNADSRYLDRPVGLVPILYGGSVKAANAGAILAVEHVDGALVGGASLKAFGLPAIVEAA